MKVLLAYSGGLDTSAILVWLQKELKAEVTCYCCDLGNSPNVNEIETRAIKYGAKDFIVEDLQEAFVEGYILPLVQSGAMYQNKYLLGTAIARPLIAERMAALSTELKMDAVSHGATGKGNDQIRFEMAWARLIPNTEIIAPWKKWDFKGRSDLVNYLASHNYAYEGESGGKYSIDENLFHKSTEGAELEEISNKFDPSSILDLASDTGPASKVSVKFTSGSPVSLSGVPSSAKNILETLNKIGSKHNIGIVDIVEDRTNGIKSRGIYQTPGGTLLKYAIDKLKETTWSYDLEKSASTNSQQFAELIYDGKWHSNAARAIQAFFSMAIKSLSGEVHLIVKNGQIFCEAITSDNMLYNSKVVSFENDEHGINQSALGYSSTITLSSKLEGLVQ